MYMRLVSCQGDFAKTVTSLLPQLTVLAGVMIMIKLLVVTELF
jgi:hypothetical protein